MDALGLTIQNVQVTERTVANPLGGGTMRQKVITYYIGGHGPFEATFAIKDYTAAAVQAAMNSEVQTLRGILTAAAGV
jgi:hypothetical protein